MRGLQLAWVSDEAYVPCYTASLKYLASCKGWMEAVPTKHQAVRLPSLVFIMTYNK